MGERFKSRTHYSTRWKCLVLKSQRGQKSYAENRTLWCKWAVIHEQSRVRDISTRWSNRVYINIHELYDHLFSRDKMELDSLLCLIAFLRWGWAALIAVDKPSLQPWASVWSLQEFIYFSWVHAAAGCLGAASKPFVSACVQCARQDHLSNSYGQPN